MFFGRTELPLVKVFGLKPDGSGTAWKFLKTGREFIQDRISSFTNMPDNVLIVNSQPQDGYMNVSVLMLSHLNGLRLNKFPKQLHNETIKRHNLLKFTHLIQRLQNFLNKFF